MRLVQVSERVGTNDQVKLHWNWTFIQYKICGCTKKEYTISINLFVYTCMYVAYTAL